MTTGQVGGRGSVLGPAEVSDAELERIVAEWLGHPPDTVRLLRCVAEVVPYELEAITTAGRYWVYGAVATPDGEQPFRFFVKHVRSFARSPRFAMVPPHLREWAADTVPWRSEARVYASDLADRLPPGLRMPRVAAIRELDEFSTAIWLEAVPAVPHTWTVADLGRAAHSIGRLAARPAVQELNAIGGHPASHPIRSYVDGRFMSQVRPMLFDDAIWLHPLLTASFDGALIERLRVAADAVPAYADELDALPFAASHGDASTNNLLVRADTDELTLIDFGFWTPKPLGFDIRQLLIGEVQLGRRPAADLPAIDAAVTAGYLAGVRDEGDATDPQAIRRCHALCLLLYSGLSLFPWEQLGDPSAITPEQVAAARERAAATRFCLDLAEAAP